jgi:hypothetical protein
VAWLHLLPHLPCSDPSGKDAKMIQKGRKGGMATLATAFTLFLADSFLPVPFLTLSSLAYQDRFIGIMLGIGDCEETMRTWTAKATRAVDGNPPKNQDGTR